MRISKKFKGEYYGKGPAMCSSAYSTTRYANLILGFKFQLTGNFNSGQTSGKEVFERKSHTSDGKEFSQQERAKYRQRHIDLEKEFIRATLHSVLKTGKVRRKM